MRHTSDEITGFGIGDIGIDTTFVLFFLALEYGRSVHLLSVDALLMAITIVMVLVLPYFLPSRYDKLSFGNWVMGRGTLTVIGVGLGVVFQRNLGVVLPDAMRFMPMTFLILAAMVSCYIQFYGLMRLRVAK